ncbi:MAG: ketopantoate reductase family protein [Xanthobacteraceae bacterium]|nr:ketopantoate reductase family protein [Xanthobacteraceae bacterium]
MRILVVGAGSTGGYFGGRLAQAGRDVTFLVRSRRAEQLTTQGLRIVTPDGEFVLQPKLATAQSLNGTYDAVLLAVKAYALESALNDVASGVGPRTMILPVLNGMSHVDIIKSRFGERSLVGCVCKIAATLDEQGRIHQLSRMHDLAYGEMDGGRSARVVDLDDQMQGAGFDARLSPHIDREMWEKWVLLASLGGITCLARGNIGQVQAATGGNAFARALIDEVVSVVNAVGTKPSEPFLASARSMLTKEGSPQTSSMFRDLQQGNRVEAEQIIGDLLMRAKSAGVSTPLLTAVNVNLSIYQHSHASAV